MVWYDAEAVRYGVEAIWFAIVRYSEAAEINSVEKLHLDSSMTSRIMRDYYTVIIIILTRYRYSITVTNRRLPLTDEMQR